MGTRSIGRLIWPQWNQPRPFPSGSQYKGLGTSRKSDFRLAISATSHTIDWWHRSKLPFKTTPLLCGIAHLVRTANQQSFYCCCSSGHERATYFSMKIILSQRTKKNIVLTRNLISVNKPKCVLIAEFFCTSYDRNFASGTKNSISSDQNARARLSWSIFILIWVLSYESCG